MSHDPHADPDMLRAAPCAHTWRYLDRFDLWYCTTCKTTESPDDEPPGVAA